MALKTMSPHASKVGLFVMLPLGLLLGACQSSAPGVAPAPLESTTAQDPQPIPEVKPRTEIARATPEPERIYPDPATLKGASASDVVGIIGNPEFIRKDQPAEIWQYRGTDCTLDIFLYQSVSGAPFKVDYIETRARPNGPTTNKTCLASILKEREAAKTARSTS